ncbi:PIN2/TERF1-interacting telomerase inhibitor 1 [Latimeria chalumnae]|uniref:PIN2/TERF1-interacting telomerase inhibitor 1 n=1 Tax=Latimeria chalumnae TaxID=7897 RepID=UPI0006D92A4B|nr:PREDICTED: PIN2/TERF1-interacting telomerase inhibitor 1 [Latimeria chalumnae]|eukprot:XP_014348175.1 PREDICTED: PIN2/TERF1-interacting telomerase inhibitor 1 [Latimeria chalumnae]
MAMLAGARRKQKWSVDPQNSSWSKDDSKFGQKMLEKMGWSKGKGLGAREQGSTDHIKVQVKNNSMGLGAAVNYEDNWIAHQDDFNQLLAELNNCHGQSATELPVSEQKEVFSLEKKSKSSKKRVHYMKFTKGKDLSSRSDVDLACVFGKRQKNKAAAADVSSSAGSQEEQEKAKAPVSPESETEQNTVTSTLTMQEYFAKRMAELKSSRGGAWRNPGSAASECATLAEETEPARGDCRRKSKKKKCGEGDEPKGKRARANAEEDASSTEVSGLVQAPELSVKKKKKRQDQHEGNNKHLEESAEAGCDGNAFKVSEARRQSDEKEMQEEQPKKKYKKKKRETTTIEEKDSHRPAKEKKSKKEKRKRKEHSD